MKKILFILVLAVAALGIESCKTMTVSTYNDLSMLRRGMDTSSVDKLFDNSTLRERQTFAVPNTPYTVKYLWVLVQLYETNGNSNRGGSSVYYTYNPFALVFEDGKLINWGFRYEFNMSENPEMRKVGASIWNSLPEERQ